MTAVHAMPELEDADAGDLARLYVITGGRVGPSGRTRIDLVTLVVAAAAVEGAARGPEQRTILRLCRTPQSAAELSAYLRLPFSATAVLIDDLLGAGMVVTRAPRPQTLPDPELLQEVLRGLQRL
jgi:hypothetical protein